MALMKYSQAVLLGSFGNKVIYSDSVKTKYEMSCLSRFMCAAMGNGFYNGL